MQNIMSDYLQSMLSLVKYISHFIYYLLNWSFEKIIGFPHPYDTQTLRQQSVQYLKKWQASKIMEN